MSNYKNEQQIQGEEYSLYFDGACKGNPGPAGAGDQRRGLHRRRAAGAGRGTLRRRRRPAGARAGAGAQRRYQPAADPEPPVPQGAGRRKILHRPRLRIVQVRVEGLEFLLIPSFLEIEKTIQFHRHRNGK